MSKRITKKWTKDTLGAFGDNANTRRGVEAEQLIFAYLKSVYDFVAWHIDDSKEQKEGNDFEFGKKTWRKHYTVDVKGNLHGRTFLVYIDEIKDKSNHRMIHVDPDTGYAVEYDRASMVFFIKNNPHLLKIDKNNKRYLLCNTSDINLKNCINYFRPFRIIKEKLKNKSDSRYAYYRLSKTRHSMDGREDAYISGLNRTWYENDD